MVRNGTLWFILAAALIAISVVAGGVYYWFASSEGLRLDRPRSVHLQAQESEQVLVELRDSAGDMVGTAQMSLKSFSVELQQARARVTFKFLNPDWGRSDLETEVLFQNKDGRWKVVRLEEYGSVREFLFAIKPEADPSLLKPLAEASSIRIRQSWSGQIGRTEVHYSLERDTNGLAGTATYSAEFSNHLRAVEDIRVPAAVAGEFLALLGSARLKEGNYQPRIEFLESYPVTEIELRSGQQFFLIFSKSQGPQQTPWGAVIQQQSYVIPSNEPARALGALRPYLKSEVLTKLVQIAQARPADSSADSTFWLTEMYLPAETMIESLPVTALNKDWAAATLLSESKLSKEGKEYLAWMRNQPDFGDVRDSSFMIEGDFNNDGAADRAAVGTYQEGSGAYGRFLAILTQSGTGWKLAHLETEPGEPGFSVIRRIDGSMVWTTCFECDIGTVLEWKTDHYAIAVSAKQED